MKYFFSFLFFSFLFFSFLFFSFLFFSLLFFYFIDFFFFFFFFRKVAILSDLLARTGDEMGTMKTVCLFFFFFFFLRMLTHLLVAQQDLEVMVSDEGGNKENVKEFQNKFNTLQQEMMTSVSFFVHQYSSKLFFIHFSAITITATTRSPKQEKNQKASLKPLLPSSKNTTSSLMKPPLPLPLPPLPPLPPPLLPKERLLLLFLPPLLLEGLLPLLLLLLLRRLGQERVCSW